MSRIRQLFGQEILDSRGRPTVKATCEFASGARASASVPSGASTGAHEAHELRDGDATRYAGLGCRQAAGHIGGEIFRTLGQRAFETQAEWDEKLIALDGSPNKARLGANALLACSLAFARAQAAERHISLYGHLAQLAGNPRPALPRLTLNLFSGGLHAGGQIPVQDVLLVPLAARSMDEGLVAASAVYHEAVRLCREKFGLRWLVADEGGLAPEVGGAEALFDLAVESIERAGLRAGRDMALAVDVAASHFYREGEYHLENPPLAAPAMIARLTEWVARWPIISVEDGLAENDWEHWPQLTAALGSRCLVMGDDLLCTNPDRIRRAAQVRACNALLLKVNQIGTLSEALAARQLARQAEWRITFSVRSGDTEDDWFADLAVGWAGDFAKIGSLTRSERLAKYNRLLEIEAELRG